MGFGVLYLSYDGILGPLGQSQVLPYLRELGMAGVRISLVSFEKPAHVYRASEAIESLRRDLAEANIDWNMLNYHKSPTVPATLYDICRGIITGSRLIHQKDLNVVHARSYVAALMAWWLSRRTGAKFLFDMRGFWADERVEGGLWHQGSLLYRVAKWCEARLLRAADAIITLTRSAKTEIERFAILGHRPPLITVIPTCVDLTRFQDRPKSARLLQALNLEGRFVLMYSGALGTWYMLDEMLKFYRFVARLVPETHFVILTAEDGERIRRSVEVQGLLPTEVSIWSVPHGEMPEWLSLADAAVFFRRPAYSLKGVFPTKLGEFLACGVPVVLNAGIGDSDEIVEGNRVGVIVSRLEPDEYDRTAKALLDLLGDASLRTRCRAVAEEIGLKQGIARYIETYTALTVV